MELKKLEQAAKNTRLQLAQATQSAAQASRAADAADQLIEWLMLYLQAQEARLQALERRLP